jgi:hypothetical protein
LTEDFIEEKVFRNNQQDQNQYEYNQFLHKKKEKAANAAVPLARLQHDTINVWFNIGISFGYDPHIVSAKGNGGF